MVFIESPVFTADVMELLSGSMRKSGVLIGAAEA
jgi:hypothetical protein